MSLPKKLQNHAPTNETQEKEAGINRPHMHIELKWQVQEAEPKTTDAGFLDQTIFSLRRVFKMSAIILAADVLSAPESGVDGFGARVPVWRFLRTTQDRRATETR